MPPQQFLEIDSLKQQFQILLDSSLIITWEEEKKGEVRTRRFESDGWRGDAVRERELMGQKTVHKKNHKSLRSDFLHRLLIFVSVKSLYIF